MARTPPSLLSGLVLLGVTGQEDERLRLRKKVALFAAFGVLTVAPLWVVTYLVLDRPLSAAIPGAYIVVTAGSLLWVRWRRTVDGFVRLQAALMCFLPMMLQWTLGGFQHGSAVGLWAFMAPVLMFVCFGPRAAVRWFAVFVVLVVVSGFFEPALRSMVPPPPEPAHTGFFVVNMLIPVAVVLLVIGYFVRQGDAANERTETLLLQILPGAIVERLKGGEAQIADRHEEATVLFADIVGFTAFADATPPERTVDLLSRVFAELDALAARHGLEKIKTLGDGYIAVAGVTAARHDHALAATAMGLEVDRALSDALSVDWPGLRLRVGLASGTVMAGVIGTERFSFDVWGDTVNTASRMASEAEPGAVQATEATHALIEAAYECRRRDAVEVKGKGLMTTYVVLGPRDAEGARQAPASTLRT